MKLPEGPATNPILQLIQWVLKPGDYMETNAAKYGDMCTISLGKDTMVMLSHPEAMQTMLTSKSISAPGEVNELLRPLHGDNSLFLQSCHRHQRTRKLVMPSFHGERMRSYGDLICQITKTAIAKAGIGRPFSAHEAMQDITMNIMLQVVFGLYESDRYEQLKELFLSYLKMTASVAGGLLLYIPALQKDWGSWSPWGRIMRKLRQIDEILYAEISERRAQLNRQGTDRPGGSSQSRKTDVLSLLISARDENGEGMTDGELRDRMMDLLVAGHETSANALTWSFYWLHQHPEVKQKLCQELDSLGDKPEPMAIFRLPYLTAVCNEILRISPVAMFTFYRVAQSPVKIMEYQFEPGAQFMGSIYLVHQREDLYPQPKQFKPERFLNKQFSPYEFIPFGAGDRGCIGMALAQFEMKLVLATILSEVEWTRTEDKPVTSKRRGFVLAPNNKIPITITSKRKSDRPSAVSLV